MIAPETGRGRLTRTDPSSSNTPFVTNPKYDVANQHHNVWGVSQPRCAPLKGSAEHIQPPEIPTSMRGDPPFIQFPVVRQPETGSCNPTVGVSLYLASGLPVGWCCPVAFAAR